MRTTKARFEIRKKRQRSNIKANSGLPRLSVFKSNKYFYAQLIDDAKGVTLASSSSLQKSFKKPGKSNNNKDIVVKIGMDMADKIKKIGATKLVFDRGGYKYHGVVKAFADAVREKIHF